MWRRQKPARRAGEKGGLGAKRMGAKRMGAKRLGAKKASLDDDLKEFSMQKAPTADELAAMKEKKKQIEEDEKMARKLAESEGGFQQASKYSDANAVSSFSSSSSFAEHNEDVTQASRRRLQPSQAGGATRMHTTLMSALLLIASKPKGDFFGPILWPRRSRCRQRGALDEAFEICERNVYFQRHVF